MENLCRLCAIAKQPKEFKCQIDDQHFDIEQKLVTCCNWNSYRSHHNLPKSVCISCFLQLEQSWYFCDTVERAQQKLCDLMQIDFDVKTIDKQQIIIDAPSFGDIQVKEENLADETLEETPIEVTSLKIENDYENYTNFNECDDDRGIDKHCYSINDDGEDDHRDEESNNDVKIVVKTKRKTTTAKVANASKGKHKAKQNVKRKSGTPKVKTRVNNAIEFDIQALLSHEDVNQNGTIKLEKIHAQNFCDWTAIKSRCYKCIKDFDASSDLWVHFTSTHSNEKIKFICPICPDEMLFLSGRYYRNHIVKTHFPHLFYCCHRCQTFFYDKKKMREHLRSHPKEPGLSVCSTCGKSFSYYKNLHFHMLSHLPVELQPLYECYLCKKSLKSHQSLQKHLKFHIGIFKSAICEQCGKAFATASKLKKHMTMHTDERPYSCISCNKTFKTNAILRRHARIHQNVKAYVCDICGYRTLDKCALKLHIVRYHTEESPFPCAICGKKFYSARTMKTHQKNMHFDHKPFACPVNQCDHRAVNRNALQRHHKHVHLNHRPHACPICSYRTYSKHNLRLHTSRRHAQIDSTSDQMDPNKYLYANESIDDQEQKVLTAKEIILENMRNY